MAAMAGLVSIRIVSAMAAMARLVSIRIVSAMAAMARLSRIWWCNTISFASKKAFDRVWHAALLATMKKYSISTNLIRVIKNFYDKATVPSSSTAAQETCSEQQLESDRGI